MLVPAPGFGAQHGAIPPQQQVRLKAMRSDWDHDEWCTVRRQTCPQLLREEGRMFQALWRYTRTRSEDCRYHSTQANANSTMR